jgi:ribosomal protein L19
MSPENTRAKAREDRMQMAPETEQGKGIETHKREIMHALVREQVIHKLGEPGDLLNVQVRLLWDARYRVNVFVGASATCARISHSFFVLTDSDGNILESTPKIKRQF